MGEKIFEQSAGFLRIRDGINPLDKSSVHPESYFIVEQMTKDLECKVEDLMTDKELRKRIVLQKYVSEKAGLPTLNDILKELDKPGRDPRKSFEAFVFEEGVNAMEDLRVGMKIPGIVTMVTITEVDAKRKRIALSMKDNPALGGADKGATGNYKSSPPQNAESDLALKLAALKGKFK
jgi:transcriptional accessory protein Tex/SPT6